MVKICDLSAWCGIEFETLQSNPLYYAKSLYLNNEKITELTIPYNVTAINPYVFYNITSLKKVTIANSVTSIGEKAFMGCSNIEYLFISELIESIGDYAFADCTDIEEIIIGAKNAITCNENIFSSDIYDNAKLYVPKNSKSSYQTTTPWNNFSIEEKTIFTVTFIIDGEVYKTETLEVDAAIIADTPVKEGYTFNGWSGIPEKMPERDITIEGSFRINRYTITYIVDGEVYATKTVEYGAEIPSIKDPAKEGHTFTWDREIPATMPAEDITIEGKNTINKYTITLLVEGEYFQKGTFKYGAKIPKLPTPDPKEGYTFKWDEEIPKTMPAENLTINGRYVKNKTAVEDVEAETEKVVYDLKGNRILDTENLERGVYIINGRKVLIK